MRNEYGEIAGVLGIARDITESTRAGEMLKEREFWLRESQMAGRVGSFDYDVAARRWSCTEAMDEIFGLPDGFDKTTEGWLSLIVECDRERMKDYHDEVIRNRETDFFEEYRLRRPVDGVERWIQIRGRFSFAPDGEPMRLIGTVFDIHDRRQAEEMLKVSESRFADIADHSQEWIWETDAAGRYSYSSRAVESMLGFTPEEIRQKSFLDLFHPHDREVSARGLLEAMSSQQAFRNLTCGVANRLGKLVWLSTSGLPFRDKDGNLLGYRGVSTDITERRLLEEKLRQSQKMEAVGQLAGGVAHDFNNILSAMMMHIHVLKGRPEASPEIRDGLGEINVQAGQAANLTRQLLLFSRQSVMQTRALRLDELVDNLLKMVRRLIGENITLVFEQGGTSPEVEADAGMLEQVIMNLMVNSRDAMPGGGRITISTKHAEIDGEQVAENPLRREGYFVMLSVSDTGCGMDSATRKRIFEPFFTTKEPGNGTGLGLATVHGIVAQHGGWIEVTSRRDHGTTFRVYLPVSDKPVPETGEDGPRAIPGGEETLLVVEDDAGVRKFLVLNLRELGYRVHEAANGHDALRLFREHREQIALLLTDMVMPGGLTGLELAEKALAERPDLKVIVSSGYSKEFAGSVRRDFGDVVFLQKPYDVPLLASMLRDCFRPR